MAAPWSSGLVPVLPSQPGVCGVCCGWAPHGYKHCVKCHDLLQRAQLPQVPHVVALSTSIASEPVGIALRRYKDGHSAAERSDHERRLAGLVEYGVQHLSCLSREAGVRFSSATCVPSGGQRVGQHPLEGLLHSNDTLRLRMRTLLNATIEPHTPREFSAVRFTAAPEAHGQNILLIDDTWTTGASVFSAAHALYAGGATSVNVLVLGRHFVPSYDHGDLYVERARRLGFDSRYCGMCDDRETHGASLLEEYRDRRARQG